MYLVYDTETTGLPKNFKAPVTDSENWPRMVQLAWQLHDDMGQLIEVKNYIVKPEGYEIPFNATKIHGISTERAQKQGMDLAEVLGYFMEDLKRSNFSVGHNIEFDINIVGAELFRAGMDYEKLVDFPLLDTKTDAVADYCKIPGGRGGKFKWPTLSELHKTLFNEEFAEAHNASADVEATARCFFELIRKGIYTEEELGADTDYLKRYKDANPNPFELIGLNIEPYDPNELGEGEVVETSTTETQIPKKKVDTSVLDGVPFSHLHNHTQFSILQSTITVNGLVDAAAKNNSPAVALTDHGNMMCAFHFVNAVFSYNKSIKGEIEEALAKGETPTKRELKPIVGCEFFVCKDRNNKDYKDNGYQTVLLAKNKKGYRNVSKLASIAFVEGFYYVPRIDKEMVVKYKEEVIATTGNLYGEIPSKILNEGEQAAEEAFVWWHEQFGDDFYVELMRHGLEEEDYVNKVLLRFAEKYGVKYFASNNTYYIKQEDSEAHDILLCVKDGEQKATPIGKGRGFRYGFPNNEFYFKSTEEMKEIFADLPEAIITTNEIADKIEPFELARDVLLPKFDIPQQFVDPQDDEDGGKRGENAFLRHLTYEGAKERYGEITPEIEERLDFELATIAKTGYPGYFLIVQDFTTASREMGVSVGPGRGSAAGSAVAYCVGITNCDPIKYDLLFERFLNPDRVSMPDIDIDFDDEGRGRVIDWVIDKYGSNQVAQIITYGTMAAKSSIRDTARVLDLPLYEADRIAKLVPDIKLGKLFGMTDDQLREKLNADQIKMANELKLIANGNDLAAETLNQARKLEGSMRNTGIHACGVIITPDDITKFVPVALAKDSDMYCTQFDNSVVEDAGLLKMDFLGLKTLTLIKDAVANVKERHGIEIDPDEIPFDDKKTYELFSRGETVGIFQFESPGMQKHLKSLKPDKFGDLIAMNALYRPGPLEYIPNFIARKHGEEEITYDDDMMKEYLEETYGITVYQEQVMLLSQSMAGFTKGMADALRKAMGKKKKAILDEMKPKFIAGCGENNIKPEVAEKVWKDWEAFAAYAFNKSHSTCYSMVAFHTGYFKAHYPAEYMASVLSNNMNDIKQVTFFMEECRRMGIEVLGPDINESGRKFRVNDEGAIRFGMAAIKGVGSSPVAAIIKEREENGPYQSVFDMVRRVDLKAVSKKVLESLALAGGFDDCTEMHRAQYFDDVNGRPFLDTIMKYGQNYQEAKNSSQVSLFGGGGDEGEEGEIEIPEPTPPACEEWGDIYKLNREKEVVGIFISGHPLDQFAFEIKHLGNGTLADLANMEDNQNKEFNLGGCISVVEDRETKRGTPFGTFEMEDYTGLHKFFVFGEDYQRLKPYMTEGAFVFVKGRVAPRKFGDGLEFKIGSIELLGEARQKYCRKIEVTIDIANLTEVLVHDLAEIFNDNPGSCGIKFTIVDENRPELKLNMPSRSSKIDLNDVLLKTLEQMESVEVSLAG